jgi:simple sugar transport system ATP-binding protein
VVSHLIIMDEPTAALGVAQTRSVLELIRRVADDGIGVVLISHNMPDVLEVSDSIQVLRLGQRVATFRRGEAEVGDLVRAMTSGRAEEER